MTRRGPDSPLSRDPGRRFLFWTLISVPGLVLLLLIAPFVVNLWRIMERDPAEVSARIDGRLAIERARDFGDEVPPHQMLDGSLEKPIVFLGGSSLVDTFPQAEPDCRPCFPALLDASIPDRAVVNLGLSGADSAYIVYRLRDVVAAMSPGMVVVYTGHNDYTNTYRTVVRPGLSLLHGTVFHWILRRWPTLPGGIGQADWALDSHFDPRVHRHLVSRGLLRSDAAEFREYDARIEAGLQRNLETMAALLGQSGTPLVLIPPISNLAVAPTAQDHAPYREALRSGDQSALRELRETDFLAPDVRARRRVHQVMSQLAQEHEHVRVVDLDAKVAAAGLTLDDSMFHDVFHFSDAGHRAVARLLEDELKPLVRSSHDRWSRRSSGALPAPPGAARGFP